MDFSVEQLAGGVKKFLDVLDLFRHLFNPSLPPTLSSAYLSLTPSLCYKVKPDMKHSFTRHRCDI